MNFKITIPINGQNLPEIRKLIEKIVLEVFEEEAIYPIPPKILVSYDNYCSQSSFDHTQSFFIAISPFSFDKEVFVSEVLNRLKACELPLEIKKEKQMELNI